MSLAFLLLLEPWGQSISQLLPYSACEFHLDIDKIILKLGKDRIDLVLTLVFLLPRLEMRIILNARLLSKSGSLFSYVLLDGLASDSLNEVFWFFLSKDCLPSCMWHIFFIREKCDFSVIGGEADVALLLLTQLFQDLKTVVVSSWSHLIIINR